MNWLNCRCLLCERKLALANHGICCICNKSIPRFSYCSKCGSRLIIDTDTCGSCLKHEPAWDSLVLVSDYSPPLSTLLHNFKFNQQYWLDKTLARLLLLAYKQARRTHHIPMPEVIIPVPLSHRRQWQRGYNQTQLIAKYLHEWLAIPLDTKSLQRKIHSQPQLGLSADKRKNNLKNVFSFQPQKTYTCVALLDDVITTGTTLRNICLELRKFNVQHIQVWTLCKTQTI